MRPPGLLSRSCKATGYIRYEDLPLEASDGRRLNVEFVSNVYWVDQQRVIQCNIRDITARKRAEAALSQSMTELQERNEELDAFAHTVAHDLKNPASLIVGYAELLTRDKASLSEDERQQYVEVIETTGYRIGTIIDELLLLARLRKSEVETAPLDMVRIVADSLNRLADNIKTAQAEIVWPDASTWPVAVGHGPWVEEVWVNYLSNALKYGGYPAPRPASNWVQPCSRTAWCGSGYAITARASLRKYKLNSSRRSPGLIRCDRTATGWGCRLCGGSSRNWADKSG